MFFAFYVHHLSPFLLQFNEQLGIRWYGLAYIAGFAGAFYLMKWLARKGYGPLKENQVADFVFYAALFGVLVGGRLGYVFFYKPEMLRDPVSILRVWEGGMSSHGGFIGVVLFSLVYARRHKISWTNLGDNLVVVAPIGLGLGRLANFINGELYGRVANVPWAMLFPKELLEPANAAEANRALAAANQIDPSLGTVEAAVQAAHTNPQIANVLREILTPRHPSQLYEAALEGMLLFAIMWFVRTRARTPNGLLTGLFMCLYAIFRIVVEYFREPDASMIAGFTRGQFFSFFMVAMGFAFIVAARWRPVYPKRR